MNCRLHLSRVKWPSFMGTMYLEALSTVRAFGKIFHSIKMKQIKNLLCLPWRISTVRKGLTMLLTGHFHWAGPLLRPLAPAHQMSGNLTQHMHTHTRRDSLSQSNDVPDFPKQPLVKHHQVRQESPSCVTASQMVPSGQKPSVLWSVWPGSH